MRPRSDTSLLLLLVAALAVFAYCAQSRAADGTLDATAESHIGVTADVTYASKYMIDGFKIGGDNPVWEPSLRYELFSTGLSVMAWSAIQINRANKQYDELDAMVRYTHDVFGREPYALNLHGFADYWFYPNKTTVPDGAGGTVELPTIRGNKFNAGFSFPRLLPLFGSYLVPSYDAYYWLYWAQSRSDLYQGGAHHELGLRYFHEIPAFIPGARSQYLGAAGTVNYHDGAFNVAPGWSHTTAQLATGVYALSGLFSASVNWQWTYAESVDPNDEFWTTMSFTKQF